MPTRYRHSACCPSSRAGKGGGHRGAGQGGPARSPPQGLASLDPVSAGPGLHRWVKNAHPTRRCLSQTRGASRARGFSQRTCRGCSERSRCEEPRNAGLSSGPRHSRGQMCELTSPPRRGPGPGCARLAVTPAPPALRLPSQHEGGGAVLAAVPPHLAEHSAPELGPSHSPAIPGDNQ